MRGVDAMGRGRQKAKQRKVARTLKYSSPETDYRALERELMSKADEDYGEYDDSEDYDDQYSEYEDYYAGEDEDEEDES
ncbi:DUF3073 domain-containing protein [Flaviflexus massiliensis]|uniref:DUF3073 domain-containing protein n=1 Tax=Flaviflexus massiliensis TaxID=1522309 RepID=UPI0036F1B544